MTSFHHIKKLIKKIPYNIILHQQCVTYTKEINVTHQL